MSRSAWVIHMSAVTLAQTTRNAPSVVRKIYRPMDPIDLRVPARGEASVRRAPYAHSNAPMLNEALFYPLFDPATKSLGQGKAFDYTQQNVNRNRVSRRPQALPVPRPSTPAKIPFGTSGLAQGFKLSELGPRQGVGGVRLPHAHSSKRGKHVGLL